MKEKTIYIEDKTKTLGDGYAPLHNNLHRDNTSLIIEDTHPSFLIIEDFNANQKQTQEEDLSSNGKKIYYAEEIFDDEDDITKYLTLNPVTGEYIAKPIREFMQLPYRRIYEND